MHGADAYNNDANFLYSDVAVAGNTYEKNVMYGSEAKVAIQWEYEMARKMT